MPCAGQPGSDPDSYCGYTINDNPYGVLPQTCATKEYFFEITNTTISPDGIERIGLVVNGQMPGPLIEANWGDTIIVHVTNSLQNNGSTIHWHGQRQNNTNEMDGVASITQCPIAPGDSMTYTFRADNYGFSWYHAHYAIQAYEGVFGPMLIHGPKSFEGDFEEQVVVLQDWSHVPVDEMYDASQSVGPTPEHGPRTMDTGLINGKNIWGQDGAVGTTGERWSMDVVPGQTYLLRLLNSAIQSTFIFSIDGHSLQVVATDFVPIVPWTTNSLALNPGQRYDVLVTFSRLRATTGSVPTSRTNAPAPSLGTTSRASSTTPASPQAYQARPRRPTLQAATTSQRRTSSPTSRWTRVPRKPARS